MNAVHTRDRIFLIMKLLYEKSDENHPLATNEIMDFLAQNGITVDRKTFREDMNFLIQSEDLDIIRIKSSPNKYFWGERVFEIPELKLLIDAVSAARFISQDKSDDLIKKLIALAGKSQRHELIRNVHGTGKMKADNRRLYYIVDILNDAINQKKKIKFQYYEYDGQKQKVLRHDGEEYILSPYALYWNEDNYYLVGFSEKRQKVITFRVDRLCLPEILEEAAISEPKDFNISDFGNKVFRMFGGEETIVKLLCKDALMKYIIDQFGTEVETQTHSDGTFTACVSVELSPAFYGWVFQFAGKMRILSPEKAVDEFKKMKAAN